MGRHEAPPFDRLPVPVQHTIVAIVPVVLAEVAHTWLPWAQDRWATSGLAGVAVTLAGLLLTAVTRQYGLYARGKDDPGGI
jgi:hypothetical protein